MRLGTKTQGWTKRDLGDTLVSQQLWIVVSVDNADGYTIQNANSQTYLTLTDGTGLHIRCIRRIQVVINWNYSGNPASNTPIVGLHDTGSTNQQWVITRTSNQSAYVYVYLIHYSATALQLNWLLIR